MLTIGVFALPLSTLLFISLGKFGQHMGLAGKSCYWSLGTIPFAGLAILSYHFGFNYVLYPAYTTEFSMIFSMLAITIIGFTANKALRFIQNRNVCSLPCIPNNLKPRGFLPALFCRDSRSIRPQPMKKSSLWEAVFFLVLLKLRATTLIRKKTYVYSSVRETRKIFYYVRRCVIFRFILPRATSPYMKHSSQVLR